ncbi:hypothetical protein ACP4OV_010031 [Aristida adscensionis]
MAKQNGGVKVTYIETSFVTSDAEGFKALVQRLTGRSPSSAAAAAPHRTRPCGAVAGDGRRSSPPAPQAGCQYSAPPAACGVDGGAQAWRQAELLEMGGFSQLVYLSTDEWRNNNGHGGGYSDGYA